MDVILKEDVKGLGYKNDIVTVKPGYGRNFLIPRGIAVLASKSNRKMIEENIRQASHKADKLRKDAEGLAEKLNGINLEIKTKVGESGKIFGAVTSLQIADALREKGVDIDRKNISFDTEVKTVGEYSATVDIHREVKGKVNFTVVGE